MMIQRNVTGVFHARKTDYEKPSKTQNVENSGKLPLAPCLGFPVFDKQPNYRIRTCARVNMASLTVPIALVAENVYAV